ncbi:hypothetical protein [Pedobacter sp. SL55]|uniref:hypothetical protein n=1 Tax=Pedobacter sp. SL55 TaxID=2995161 RepID=UPI00226EA14D|nr:hypothetical protein [Pedobacter sp. SL55]WAC40905.1 hypothetical protein OVA16_00510 [Pedobacter sp. SL55]
MTNIQIGNYFLEQFNVNLGENFKIEYNETKSEFSRTSHDIRFNHYFDDYCIMTINWLIKIKNHDIQEWIDEETYSKEIFNTFHSRRLIFPESEAKLFLKIFGNLEFDMPYFTEEQKAKLTKQVKDCCEIVKDYIPEA